MPNMTTRDRAALVRELSFRLLPELQALFAAQLSTCMNCEHFREKTELCHLVGKRPPIKVAVVGCESWCLEVPF